MRRVTLTALLGIGACFSDAQPSGDGAGSTSTTSATGGPTSSLDSDGPGPTSDDTGTVDDTGPDPLLCGNGEIDEGEDCDDANDVDADGCNVDCRASGSVRWIDVLENGMAGASDYFLAVAVDSAGQIYAGGKRTGQGDDANLVRFDEAYALVYDQDVVATAGHDNLRSILVAADGTVYVAGDRDIVVGVSGSAWVASVEGDGQLANTHVLDPPGRNAYYALAEEGGGLVAAGHRGEGNGTAAHIEHYTPILTPLGGETPAVSDGPDLIAVTAAATSDEHGVYVAGYLAQSGFVRGFATALPEGGTVHIDADPAAHTWVVDAVLLAAGDASRGFVTVGWSEPSTRPSPVARLDFVERDGAHAGLETWAGPDEQGAYYEGVGVDGAGNLIVAGGLSLEPSGTIAFVRKLDPTGAELWLQTVEADAFPFSGINAVGIAPDDRIVVVGSASDAAGVARRMIAVLAP